MKRLTAKFNGITIKYYTDFQLEILTKVFEELELKKFPINKKTIRFIHFENNFKYPGYHGYQWQNGIHLNAKKIKEYKQAKTKRKFYINFFWLIIHELIHAIDKDRKITQFFLDDYWDCLEKVRNNIGSKLFEYKNRKSVFDYALPMYRKLKKFDPYRRYDKRVRKVSGAPNTYSLMAPYEFVAELFSFYFMRKSSIPSKKLLKKVDKYFLQNIKK